MDHEHMHHMAMGHGDMGHDGMDHGDGMHDMCSMSMLFTWDTNNLCIVFRQWHIRSTLGLILSLAAVVLIAMGYEALRELSRRYEAAVAKKVEGSPRPRELATETTPLTPGRNQVEIGRQAHMFKSVLYGLQNFYAFMLMLLFMTYNGWVMIAVSLGAALGYYFFGGEQSSTKDNACH